MKLLKKILLSILIITTVFTFSQITPLELPTTSIVQASNISINRKRYTLVKGSTFKLKINGTSKKVKWSSNNKKIATVNSNGKVTAKKKGTCTITGKVNEKKYTCKITVKNAKANYVYNTSKSNSSTNEKSSIVYITKTGKKYHKLSCRTLRSIIKTTKKEAQARGYTACKVCYP